MKLIFSIWGSQIEITQKNSQIVSGSFVLIGNDVLKF